MSIENLNFYDDDEGMAVDLALTSFGPDFVQCINLESNAKDQKMKNGIAFIVKNQQEISIKIKKAAAEYTLKAYGKNSPQLSLLKIYLFPEEEEAYGFMFSTDLDEEHGIGVKLSGLNIIKIGSAETSFM